MRQEAEWHDWTNSLAYRYAVRDDGRLYPPKVILGLITGRKRTAFSGGDDHANSKLRAFGLEVVRLRRVWLCGSQGNKSQYRSHAGYSDVLGERYLFDNKVPNSRQLRRDDAILIWKGGFIIGASLIDQVTSKPNVAKVINRCPVCATTRRSSTLKQLESGLWKCDVPSHSAFTRPTEESVSVTQFCAHYAKRFAVLQTPLSTRDIRNAAVRYNERYSIRLVDAARLITVVADEDDGMLAGTLAYFGALDHAAMPGPEESASSTHDEGAAATSGTKTIDVARIKAALDGLESLDRERGVAKVRAERGLIERWLFRDSDRGRCAFCERELPRGLLVGAHLKKRTFCTKTERLDIENVVVRACTLGCDSLYERGYIVVREGKIAPGRAPETTAIASAVAVLAGRACAAWSVTTAKYFRWHAQCAPDPGLASYSAVAP